MTCYCCGAKYERGKFRCCAPPNGMRSDRWLEKFCRVDIGNDKRCNRCARCGCEHRKPELITGNEIGMSAPADIAPARFRGELTRFAERWSPHKNL